MVVMSFESISTDREGARGEAAYAVLRQVRPLHQLSARAVAAALEGSPLTVPMRAVMERLADAGPQPVPQIARSLWIARQGVQRVVDDAMAAGYVERRRNPEHARSWLIALTDRGRAEYDELHRAEMATLTERLAGLSVEELDQAARVLARFVEAIGGGEGVAAEAEYLSESVAEPSVAAADRGE